MKTKDVITYFGSYSKLAEKLNIDQSAARHWGEEVPELRQYHIQVLTNGTLKADSEIAQLEQSKPSDMNNLILDALQSAEHELTTLSGLVATDRPDLPLSEETSWTINPSVTLNKLRDAISAISDSESGA